MTDTTMNTGAASLSDERERAAITACALMIKGICLTRPNAEWTGAIEDRIQFMLKQMQAGAAISAGGAQEADAHIQALVDAAKNVFELANHFNVSGVYFTEDDENRDALQALEDRIEAVDRRRS